MPFVTWVTPGTVDVKLSAAAKAVVNGRKVQNDIKYANIDFRTCLCLSKQMINKLIENGKIFFFY